MEIDENLSEGKKNSLANLKPFTELTEEERKDFCRKGALAVAKKKRERRTMKETLLEMLDSKEIAKKLAEMNGNPLLIQATEEGATVNDLLMLSAMFQSLDGNVKAMEFTRDTSGQKPKEDLNIQADVITASDRALIDKLKRNIGQNDEESEG